MKTESDEIIVNVAYNCSPVQSSTGSTTETGYVSLFHEIQEGMWINGLLKDLNIFVGAFTIYEDYISGIKSIRNDEEY